MTHLGLQRIMIPGSQVSALTTGNISLAGAKGAFEQWGGPEGAYDALATTTLSSTTSSITFNGIPDGYKHLQIRARYRATSGAGDGTTVLRFNDDSSASYSSHRIYGYGSGNGGSDNTVSGTSAAIGHSMGATPELQSFCGMVTDVLDYSNVSKNKTIRSLTGTEMNSSGTGAIFFNSSAWYNLSRVQSITITTNQTAFATYSSFALYGVR